MKQDYKIWANDFHPVALKSDRWVRQKIDYIHYNPVRKGFVELPEHWKYSSARNWILGDDRIIENEQLRFKQRSITRTETSGAASGGESDWSPVSGDPSRLYQKPNYH